MTTEICLPVNTLAQLEGAVCAGVVVRNRRKFAAFCKEGCTVYLPLRPKTAKRTAKAHAPKRDAALYDTRTAPECWLVGDDRKALHRAQKRAAKGEYRSILVRLADGYECRAGSHLIDDEAAKAEAIRTARNRAMEARFAADEQAEVERCRNAGFVGVNYVEPHPFVWAPTGQHTRACEVADVAEVRFVMSYGDRWTPLAADYLAHLRARAERLRDAVETFAAMPDGDALPQAA